MFLIQKKKKINNILVNKANHIMESEDLGFDMITFFSVSVLDPYLHMHANGMF